MLVFLILGMLPYWPSLGVSAEANASPKSEITAAVLDDFPPLYTRDAQGDPAGFAVDVLGRVASRAGLKVRAFA